MPRDGQIIPEYLVPHVKTYINDNSIFEDIAQVPVDDGIRLLCVFASARGEDRVVKTFTDVNDYIAEYGTPNYDLYGQACYMPYAALLSGRAKVHCMRIMPADAAYSNIIIYANVKTETDTTVSPNVTEVKTYFSAKYEDPLTDPDSLQAAVDVNTDGELNSTTGYTAYPIMGFRCKGRGTYGDSLRVRLTVDTTLDKENEYKNYILEIFNSGAYGSREIWRCTLNPNAIVSNESLFLTDVVNDPEAGSALVEAYISVDGLKAVYAQYAAVAGTGAVPETEFDFLTGMTKAGTAITGYKIIDYTTDATITDGVRIDNVSGLVFGGGSEGSFVSQPEPVADSTINPLFLTEITAPTVEEAEAILKDPDTYTSQSLTLAAGKIVKVSIVNDRGERVERDEYYENMDGSAANWKHLIIYADEAMDAEYIAAFTGVHPNETAEEYANHPYDPAIRSKRRTPAELILDANYSSEVKAALVQLALNRYDAQLYLDAGIINTIAQASEWGTEVEDYADAIINKECQHYDIKDPFTGKKISLTTTYFLAQNLPTHIYNEGGHVPFVGQRFSQLSGHIKNSVRPLIDADDLLNKEILYNKKVNFMECIAENVYIRGTQNTSQTEFSDLSEQNNMNTLLLMKRQLEDLVSGRLYDFSDDESRRQLTEDAERLFSGYINSKIREFTISFSMNEFEETRSILHCYLAVTFRTLAKRAIIEIDINKRV